MPQSSRERIAERRAAVADSACPQLPSEQTWEVHANGAWQADSTVHAGCECPCEALKVNGVADHSFGNADGGGVFLRQEYSHSRPIYKDYLGDYLAFDEVTSAWYLGVHGLGAAGPTAPTYPEAISKGFSGASAWCPTDVAESDWVATPGGLILETPGESHTLVSDHPEGCKLFGWMQGPIEFYDDKGVFVDTTDVWWFINHYETHCREHDLAINPKLYL